MMSLCLDAHWAYRGAAGDEAPPHVLVQRCQDFTRRQLDIRPHWAHADCNSHRIGDNDGLEPGRPYGYAAWPG
jgi:hypothetical protein